MVGDDEAWGEGKGFRKESELHHKLHSLVSMVLAQVQLLFLMNKNEVSRGITKGFPIVNCHQMTGTIVLLRSTFIGLLIQGRGSRFSIFWAGKGKTSLAEPCSFQPVLHR